jgi:hypothetical protein
MGALRQATTRHGAGKRHYAAVHQVIFMTFCTFYYDFI